MRGMGKDRYEEKKKNGDYERRKENGGKYR